MSKTVECVRCRVPMEEGFVIDGRHPGFVQQQWSSGVPQPSFWLGLTLEKGRIAYVTTWRCPECGYLESYATRQQTAPE